jgi:hypothetical protein
VRKPNVRDRVKEFDSNGRRRQQVPAFIERRPIKPRVRQQANASPFDHYRGVIDHLDFHSLTIR